jgi:hypothetical protein
MTNNMSWQKNPMLYVPIAFFMTACMWVCVEQIIVPAQIKNASELNQPRGNLSDLYPRWVGTRELLLHKRDPYSREVTREIQVGYYGRALDPAKPNDPKDKQGFAYPVYVVFLLAPTMWLSFTSLQKDYMEIIGLLTAISVFLWAAAIKWKPRKSLLWICVLLVLGSVPFVQGIKLQQLSLLTAFFIAVCFAAVSRGYLVTAGIFLALATIKPQLVWLLVVLLLAWVVRNWRTRQRLLWSFMVTMAVLFIASEIILPGWLVKFGHAIVDYYRYTSGPPIAGWVWGPLAGGLFISLLLLIAAKICWPLLREPATSNAFAIAICLAITVMVIVIPVIASYNQILLLPAVLLIVRDGRDVWGQGRLMKFLCVAIAILIFWPWLISSSLFVALRISPAMAEKDWRLLFYPSFILPLALFGIVALHGFRKIPSRKISKPIPVPTLQ